MQLTLALSEERIKLLKDMLEEYLSGGDADVERIKVACQVLEQIEVCLQPQTSYQPQQPKKW